MKHSALRVLLLAMSAAVLAACGVSRASVCGNMAGVDRPLPTYTGTLLDGSKADLAPYANGTVVFNIWGSWCGPCRNEAPELLQATKVLSPQGVRFVGVDVRDSRTAASQFQQEFGIPYPSFYDNDSQLAASLSNAPSPPVTLVSKNGRLVAQIYGSTSAATIECAVQRGKA